MDIVVFGPHDAEEIKAYIVDHHDRFSLEDPLKPGATYKILYFNLHRGFNWRCKVDILVSGRHLPLHIPRIPRQHIKYLGAHTSDIPVVPFLVLLILKVQGWRDNCRDRRWDKIPRDIEDVNTLLSRENIKKTALRTIAIPKDGGYDGCLFGSAASSQT